MDKKVLIYGAYDLDNLGDDYMMYAIDDFLKSKNIKPVYVHIPNRLNYFDMNIDETLDIPFKMKYKNKFLKLIKIITWLFKRKDIEDIDALIFMGGGYTNEKFGLKNLLNIYFTCQKFRNKKIYFTGQTVGPVNNVFYKILIKNIYKKADKVCVRERFSQELLNNFKIDNKLIGDDAFLSKSNINKSINSHTIIFNYKDFEGYDEYKSEYFKFLLEIAKLQNKRILVIPFRSSVNSNEYKSNYKLYEFLKQNNINADFIVERDIKKFQQIFRSSEIVIGTAYHSIVLGLLYNNRVFGLYSGEYYKMKIKGILNWYDIENSNAINLIDIDNIVDKFNKIIDNDNMNNNLEITEKISNNVNTAWNEITSEILKN